MSHEPGGKGGPSKEATTRAATLAIIVVLSGCSVSSGLCDATGPSKTASMALAQNVSTQQVFACLDQATSGNGDRPDYAGNGKAMRDIQAGAYETDQYRASNVSGFRLKAEISTQNASTLNLSLRGAGAYCSDLGVDKEMARLQDDLSRCLQP